MGHKCQFKGASRYLDMFFVSFITYLYIQAFLVHWRKNFHLVSVEVVLHTQNAGKLFKSQQNEMFFFSIFVKAHYLVD